MFDEMEITNVTDATPEEVVTRIAQVRRPNDHIQHVARPSQEQLEKIIKPNSETLAKAWNRLGAKGPSRRLLISTLRGQPTSNK